MNGYVRIALRALAILLVLAVATEWQPKARSARLLEATIKQDGQVVMRAILQDGGLENALSVWNSLSEASWEPEAKAATTVQVDSKDPLQGVLSGGWTIEVHHTDKLIVSARGVDLMMTRALGSDIHWRIPDEEIEQWGIANGIIDAPSFSGSNSNRWLLGVSALGGLGIVLLGGRMVLKNRSRVSAQG